MTAVSTGGIVALGMRRFQPDPVSVAAPTVGQPRAAAAARRGLAGSMVPVDEPGHERAALCPGPVPCRLCSRRS